MKLNDPKDIWLEIRGTLAAIQIDIAEIRKDLELHIYRTELAEENIELLRKELSPVKEHVTRIDGVLRFLGALSLILGIATAIAGIYNVVP